MTGTESSSGRSSLPHGLTIVDLDSEIYRDRYSMSLARTLAQAGASPRAVDAAGGVGVASSLAAESAEKSLHRSALAGHESSVADLIAAAAQPLATQMSGRIHRAVLQPYDPRQAGAAALAVALQAPPGTSSGIGGHGEHVSRRPEAAPPIGARGSDAGLRRDVIFRRVLSLADISAVAAALVLTVALTPNSLHLTWASLVGIPIVLLIAKLLGLYDHDESPIQDATLDEAPKLFQMATLVAAVAWIADGFIAYGALRPGALLLWAWITALLVAARALARALALVIMPAERLLFIGDDQAAQAISSRVTGSGGSKRRVIAHLDIEQVAPWLTDSFSESTLQGIRDFVETLDVHRVIIAPRSIDPSPMLLDLVLMLNAAGVKVSVVPQLLGFVGSAIAVDDEHGVTVVGLRRLGLARSSSAIKRSFDLLGASLGLLAISPLLITFAIAIKLDSRGPVFFRQMRVGRHGRRFYLLKFRTMVLDADAMKESRRDRSETQEGLFKIAQDPRVTRTGRFLRVTALDELPQLINVVKGNMSLVGPRPLAVGEKSTGGSHDPHFELRPGITGPSQILGPVLNLPRHEMVAVDYLYLVKWSLWTDIKLLLRSIPRVVNDD